MSPIAWVFLVLHVVGAVFVFGPSMAFPIIAGQAQRMPQHGHFAAVVADAIERRIVLPGAVVQGITGLALILAVPIDLTSPAWHWLFGGILLYAIAIAFAFLVQARNSEKMVELTKTPPPPGAAPSGPPPEIVAIGQKLARGGMFLTVMIVAIVTLMVTKPVF